MCQCLIAKLVVSRFSKDRDVRKQWVFVVKRVSTDNSAWIPGDRRLSLMIMMSCVSVTRPILITDRLNHFVRRVTLIS